MKSSLCLALLVGLIFSETAMSDGEFRMLCKPTEQKGVDLYNQFDLSYNDITIPRWSFEDSAFKKIIFKGVLVDSDCVPISDAHIRIWEGVGAAGIKNHYSGGETYSDNLGRFDFIVMPGSICAQPNNYMNISVSHQYFKNIETKIIVKNCSGNGVRTMLLVMDGRNKYRRY